MCVSVHYRGVAGMPLFLALSLSPILSIQVPQLKRFPPLTKPVLGSTRAVTVNPDPGRGETRGHHTQLGLGLIRPGPAGQAHHPLPSSTFISHVHVNLGSCVPLSEVNPLQVPLHCFLDHIVQGLLLHTQTITDMDSHQLLHRRDTRCWLPKCVSLCVYAARTTSSGLQGSQSSVGYILDTGQRRMS